VLVVKHRETAVPIGTALDRMQEFNECHFSDGGAFVPFFTP